MSDERACQQFTATLLIDGHNRYEICTRLGVGYNVSEMAFDCRDDAEDWIDRNQLGKRNLSPADFSIASGRVYNRRKKAAHDGGKGKKRSEDQIDPHLPENTAAEVAEELGVGEATIKRNGQRAALHDAMMEIGDDEAAEAVETMPQAHRLNVVFSCQLVQPLDHLASNRHSSSASSLVRSSCLLHRQHYPIVGGLEARD